MAVINHIESRFNRYANVGNLLSVLIIAVIVIIKPDGAPMV